MVLHVRTNLTDKLSLVDIGSSVVQVAESRYLESVVGVAMGVV